MSSFASCFSAAPGAACGAVSAVFVTVVDRMYEVAPCHILQLLEFSALFRFTLTLSLPQLLQILSILSGLQSAHRTCQRISARMNCSFGRFSAFDSHACIRYMRFETRNSPYDVNFMMDY